MKEKYEIKFSPSVSINIKNKDGLNEKIVYEIITKFSKDSNILKKQKLLIYFGMQSERFFRASGSLIIKGTLEYEILKKKIENEINDIPYFEGFEYVIYLTRDIRENESEIFKTFTIAHELQHVIQDINFKSSCLKASILIKYFKLKGTWTNEIYRQIPTEMDAFIKSKKINFNISGKNNVDDFIDNKIHEIKSKIERTRSEDGIKELKCDKSYWENIQYLDIESNYDLKNETNIFWENHEEDIEKEAIRLLKEKKERVELEEKKKEFLDVYENYLMKCKQYVEPSGSQIP